MDKLIAERYSLLNFAFDERMRRLFVAAEATALGYGGISLVAKATGVSRMTIHEGIKELAERTPGETATDHIRKKGGGRKKATESHPELKETLQQLVEPSTRGDPESPLLWTCKSLRVLAEELAAHGYEVSYPVVGQLLKDMGYSLQANSKVLEGSQHPDRNAQFEYINAQAKEVMAAGNPVISVDAKKKELVGEYHNKGQTWRPKGDPEKVKVHDFVDPTLGRANPYGIYDIQDNNGWVSVGADHDTASFAVESIRRWWHAMGKERYTQATEIMITADGGGSNSRRSRLWKLELQSLANELGMKIHVNHLPPGTSKWNKIEHRMFSHISMNWRGKPLISHETIVTLIANTRTKAGLVIRAELDKNLYPTGIKVSEDAFNAINITPAEFHGEWNYSIAPKNE
jgi:transposase